jgi:sugar phosphate isomerase/epimerase
MGTLTHGSDLTLAPTIGVLLRGGASLSAALAKLGPLGLRAVQLDATVPGLRPRDLNHAARRDLAAILSRASFRAGGIDFLIPREHYTHAGHVDRAMEAALGAIRLAADLGRLPVSLELPAEALDAPVARSLIEAADGHGVALVVHASESTDRLRAWVDAVDLPALGAGVDPAAEMVMGRNPVDQVNRWGVRLRGARLSDGPLGAGLGPTRRVLGQGALDVASYRVALDLCGSLAGPVVLDLQGLVDPLGAAGAAAAVWERAAFRV